MKFSFDGKQYKLTFSRANKKIELQREGRVKEVTSRHPYTTAKLYELRTGGEQVVLITVSVGCFKDDTYNKKWGTYYALRKLTKKLADENYPKDLPRAAWRAYLDRNNEKPEAPETNGSGSASDVVDAVSVQKVTLPALPAHEGENLPLQPSEIQTTGESVNGWTVH